DALLRPAGADPDGSRPDGAANGNAVAPGLRLSAAGRLLHGGGFAARDRRVDGRRQGRRAARDAGPAPADRGFQSPPPRAAARAASHLGGRAVIPITLALSTRGRTK